MNKPLISVIMPVHNNAGTLLTAINSIRKQTYENLEIIVIDDQSTDDTAEVVASIVREDARVTYYKMTADDFERIDPKLKRNVNAGYSARNFGFKKAHGELITFQDGDDASLLNRIEVQYELLKKYNATHVTIGLIRFNESLVGTKGNEDTAVVVIDPEKIYRLSQRTKGLVPKLFPILNRNVPFHLKRLRIINKFFFGSLEPYPGSGNCPLFKREVIDKVQFRRLKDRIWPSFMGRGADRDFNFQVAETFKNSYAFDIPLYLWRT